jgi:hypothetical protein
VTLEQPAVSAPHPVAILKGTATDEVPSPMAQGAGEDKPLQSEVRPDPAPERR